MTKPQPHDDQRSEDAIETPVRRGQDDRRSEVKPNENPAPSSPPADADVVRAGEETLERVKPY